MLIRNFISVLFLLVITYSCTEIGYPPIETCNIVGRIDLDDLPSLEDEYWFRLPQSGEYASGERAVYIANQYRAACVCFDERLDTRKNYFRDCFGNQTTNNNDAKSTKKWIINKIKSCK